MTKPVINSLQEALEVLEAAICWLKEHTEQPKVLDKAPIRLIPNRHPEESDE